MAQRSWKYVLKITHKTLSYLSLSSAPFSSPFSSSLRAFTQMKLLQRQPPSPPAMNTRNCPGVSQRPERPPRVGGRRCESPGASRVLNAWSSQWFGAGWGEFSAPPRSGFPGLGSSFPSRPSQRALPNSPSAIRAFWVSQETYMAASISRAGDKVWGVLSLEIKAG